VEGWILTYPSREAGDGLGCVQSPLRFVFCFREESERRRETGRVI
jgi:hypothetical protein